MCRVLSHEVGVVRLYRTFSNSNGKSSKASVAMEEGQASDYDQLKRIFCGATSAMRHIGNG